MLNSGECNQVGDLKVAGSMELVHEAEAIGVAAGRLRLDEALEDT
jgi:hypothetical protein